MNTHTLLLPGDKLYKVVVTSIDDDEPCVSVSVDTYKVICDAGGFGGVCVRQISGSLTHLLVIDTSDIGVDSYHYTRGGYARTVEEAIELYRLRYEDSVASLKRQIDEKERLFGTLFQVAEKVINGEHYHVV